MKITSDVTLEDFQSWSGATSTQEKIIEAGKADAFESMIEELYPDGMTATELNDLLWFEEEFIYEHLGIRDDSEENDEDESEDE